jgi:peptidyl-dipeptidase A
MMSYGTSQPWQDTLEAAIGAREMDAAAILDYFAPLAGWLEGQNAGRSCGWD